MRTIKWAVGEADFIAEFVEKHKGKQLPAIVEYVRDAGSFRLAIRTEEEDESHLSFVYCSLSLSGILCPGLRRSPEGKTVAEPFAGEDLHSGVYAAFLLHFFSLSFSLSFSVCFTFICLCLCLS